MQEWRCKSCRAKLAEFWIAEGTVEILCKRNLGRERCNTMNVITAKRQIMLVEKAIKNNK